MAAPELAPETWEALTPQIGLIRDGLLDARQGLLRAMAIADEHDEPDLHRRLADRVIAIDDMIAFVSPSIEVAGGGS